MTMHMFRSARVAISARTASKQAVWRPSSGRPAWRSLLEQAPGNLLVPGAFFANWPKNSGLKPVLHLHRLSFFPVFHVSEELQLVRFGRARCLSSATV